MGSNNHILPRHYSTLTESEEEEITIDFVGKKESDSQTLKEFYQKPLVLAPDEVLPGSNASAPKPRASVQPLPQIFESLETVKKSTSQADSEVKLKTTATGTIISVPPDVPEMPSLNPKDKSSIKRLSLSKADLVSQDLQALQIEQPKPLDSLTIQPDQAVVISMVPEDLVECQIYPKENDLSGNKTKVSGSRVSLEPSVPLLPKTQTEESPITQTSFTTSVEKPQLTSTKAGLPLQERPPPESQLRPEVKSGISGALDDQLEEAAKAPATAQDTIEDILLPAVSTQSSELARAATVSKVLTGAPQPELNTIFVKSEPKSVLEKLKSTTASEPIPATSKVTADMSEAQAIMSEPYEVPYTDGIQSTPSGLALHQEAGTSKPRPSVDSLTGQTLQNKCRVKDYLIKNMADHLKDLAKKNMWSGNKLFKDISRDPVKTYDFDRTTLCKYIKGQEPQDLTPSLKSNEPYSSSNPLNVKLGRKLDKDSLLLEWGPPPSQEVVGFQIFINGEFKYWVHSAKRSKALLHPVDLANRMVITVSPVNAKGDIVYRSSVTYNP